MNSLCIKTNNENILKYLQKEFSEFNMLNVFYSRNEFKLYKNIIIHYTGIDNELFYTKLSTILSYLVIDYFETDIIKNILKANYFYFDTDELKKVFNLCIENLCEDEQFSFNNRQLLLFDAFYNYLIEHHSIVLSGFINFRLKNYRDIIESLVDFSVNEYIIEREYFEFISLLKVYINSQPSSNKIVHLISLENDTFLLDDKQNLINIDKSVLKAKYLSDVSFSKNDYVLNTLLNILPQKIYLHLVSSLSNLDFLNTLKLIFENRIEICCDCNICNLYKNITKKTGIEN